MLLPRGGVCSIPYLPDFGCHALSCVCHALQIDRKGLLGVRKENEKDTFFAHMFVESHCTISYNVYKILDSGWRQGGWAWLVACCSVASSARIHRDSCYNCRLFDLWRQNCSKPPDQLCSRWPMDPGEPCHGFAVGCWNRYPQMYWTDLNRVKKCDDSTPKIDWFHSDHQAHYRWHLAFFKVQSMFELHVYNKSL